MKLSPNDQVTLSSVPEARGVVEKTTASHVTIKWSNGNIVDITNLLAANIVRKL